MAEINWHGTTFTWNGNTVGNITDMSASFSEAVADIDITNIADTSCINLRPGRAKAGMFEFSLRWNPDDTGWAAMNTDRYTNTARTCVLTCPTGSTNIRQFTGKIVSMDGPVSNGEDSVYSGKVKIKLISAEVTETD